MDGPLLWFLNRGTGLVLLGLLTLATALGVSSLRARSGGRVPGFVVQALHRNLSLLSMGLLVAHVATAVADEYVDIRWWQSFVPWDLAYRPWWLGLGTLAFDILAATTLTTLVRARLGRRMWRAVHRTTYAAWALGVVHGLGIGTDTGEGWARAVYLGSTGVIVVAALRRVRAVPDMGEGRVAVGR